MEYECDISHYHWSLMCKQQAVPNLLLSAVSSVMSNFNFKCSLSSVYHRPGPFRNIFFRKFWKIMKILFFASVRKNRQIYEGAIFLIYQRILINLDIKLIVDERNPIKKSCNFRFLRELCSKNVKERKNWPSESKKNSTTIFFRFFPMYIQVIELCISQRPALLNGH